MATDTLSMSPTTETEPASAKLARGAWLLVLVTWVLIGFGALVRAKKAGLACPDWPLCYDMVVPDIRIEGVIYEFGHRVLAGLVSIGFVALGFFSLRDKSVAGLVRKPVLLAGGVLLVQIVMGGLTVLIVERGHGGDPRPAAWTVTSHLLLGNSFAALVAVAAWRMARRARAAASERLGSPLLVVWTVALLAQFVLGGMVSSNLAGLVCIDFPQCSGDTWIPSLSGLVGLQVLHRLNAYLLAILGIALALKLRKSGPAALIAKVVGVAILLQILAGALNIWWRIPPSITVAHSALASLLFLSTALLWEERRSLAS